MWLPMDCSGAKIIATSGTFVPARSFDYLPPVAKMKMIRLVPIFLVTSGLLCTSCYTSVDHYGFTATELPVTAYTYPQVVVIRYPTFESELAATKADDAFLDYWQRNINPKIAGSIDVLSMKSAYYAAEFAKLLRAQIPNATVILEPGIIDVNEHGQFFFDKPIRSRPLPSVLVDFYVYIDATTPTRATFDVSSTAETTLTPQITIRTFAELSPDTGGLVATTRYWLNQMGRKQLRSSMPYDSSGATLVDVLNAPSHKRSDYDLLLHENSIYKDIESKTHTWAPGKVLVLPILSAKLVRDPNSNHYEIPKNKFLYLASILTDVLRVADNSPSIIYKYYSDMLGVDTVVETAEIDPTHPLVLAYNAEAAFLSRSSKRTETALLEGQFGNAFRLLREEETKNSPSIMAQWLQATATAMTYGGGYQGMQKATESIQASNAAREFRTINSMASHSEYATEIGITNKTVSAKSLSELRAALVPIVNKSSAAGHTVRGQRNLDGAEQQPKTQ